MVEKLEEELRRFVEEEDKKTDPFIKSGCVFWECLNCGYSDDEPPIKGTKRCPNCNNTMHINPPK